MGCPIDLLDLGRANLACRQPLDLDSKFLRRNVNATVSPSCCKPGVSVTPLVNCPKRFHLSVLKRPDSPSSFRAFVSSNLLVRLLGGLFDNDAAAECGDGGRRLGGLLHELLRAHHRQMLPDRDCRRLGDHLSTGARVYVNTVQHDPVVPPRIGSAAEALIRENTVWLPEWLPAAFRQPV